MMKTITVLLLVLCLAGIHPVSAQTFSSSPYSVYGVGLLKSRTSAHNRGLGGTGIGVRSPYSLNTLNPASYSAIKPVTQLFELGFYYEMDQYETTEYSNTYSTGNITAFTSWFRFSPNWAGTIGLAPYSTVNYNIMSQQNLGTGDNASVQFTGSGGFSQFYFGNGIQVTKNLSLGITGSFIFGNITKGEKILSGDAYGIELSNRIAANKLAADAGMQYSFFLKNERTLTLGATYSPEVQLSTSQKISVFEASGDSLTVEQKDVNAYKLPQEFGAGLSFHTIRSLLAVDLTLKQWQRAVRNENDSFRDSFRFSLGYEYKGNPKGKQFVDFISIRTGLFAQQNYLKLKGTSFMEWGYSIGAGLPVSENKGTISIAYHYNHSGTKANDLIQQRAHVISLDLSMRDFWFIKRKFD